MAWDPLFLRTYTNQLGNCKVNIGFSSDKYRIDGGNTFPFIATSYPITGDGVTVFEFALAQIVAAKIDTSKMWCRVWFYTPSFNVFNQDVAATVALALTDGPNLRQKAISY